MQKRHGDARLAAPDRAHRANAAPRIVVDVLVPRLQKLECLVLAEYLHERGDRRIRGTRCIGIGHLQLVLVDRIAEVFPTLRRRDLLFGENFRVVRDAKRAGVDTDRVEFRLLGLSHCPIVELRQHRRFVFLGESHLCRLQMWIAGPGVPEIDFRIRFFRGDLSHRFAGRFLRERDLDARVFLKRIGDRLAPRRLDAAHDVQLTLCGRGGCEQRHRQHRQRSYEALHDASCVLSIYIP